MTRSSGQAPPPDRGPAACSGSHLGDRRAGRRGPGRAPDGRWARDTPWGGGAGPVRRGFSERPCAPPLRPSEVELLPDLVEELVSELGRASPEAEAGAPLERARELSAAGAVAVDEPRRCPGRWHLHGDVGAVVERGRVDLRDRRRGGRRPRGLRRTPGSRGRVEPASITGRTRRGSRAQPRCQEGEFVAPGSGGRRSDAAVERDLTELHEHAARLLEGEARAGPRSEQRRGRGLRTRGAGSSPLARAIAHSSR